MNTYNFKPAIWIPTILLIVGFLFPLNAISRESIGHVIQSIGTLTATNSDGKTRILRRGSRIIQGDVIKSGRSSIAQLRMNDKALISLRQNTEFRFDKYKYTENEQTNSSVFSLLKGGFRTITGLIGKRNKKNYQVKTSVATIGVRGTHYGLALCSSGSCDGPDGNIEDGLYGSVVDGEITTENEAGLFAFSNDEYFHLTSKTSVPKHLIKPPGVIFGQHKLDRKLKKMKDNKQQLASMVYKRSLQQSSMLHVAIDQKRELLRNPTDQPFFESTADIGSNAYPLPSEQGDILAYSFYQGLPGNLTKIYETLRDNGSVNNRFALNAIAADNGKFIPLASEKTTPVPLKRKLFFGEAQISDVGSITLNDGSQLGWGRWSGKYANDINGTPRPHTGALHYIVAEAGALTPPGRYTTMTGIFNYNTIAGTRATDHFGNIAANLADITMNVDFQTNVLLGKITSFTVATNVGGNIYEGQFTGALAIPTAINTGITLGAGGICTTCAGKATIGFIGPQAEGAFTTYIIDKDSTITNGVTGSAILKQAGAAPM